MSASTVLHDIARIFPLQYFSLYIPRVQRSINQGAHSQQVIDPATLPPHSTACILALHLRSVKVRPLHLLRAEGSRSFTFATSSLYRTLFFLNLITSWRGVRVPPSHRTARTSYISDHLARGLWGFGFTFTFIINSYIRQPKTLGGLPPPPRKTGQSLPSTVPSPCPNPSCSLFSCVPALLVCPWIQWNFRLVQYLWSVRTPPHCRLRVNLWSAARQ